MSSSDEIIEDDRITSPKEGILVHTLSGSSLSIKMSTSTAELHLAQGNESRIVSRLRSTVENTSIERLSPSNILNDSLLAADIALSSLNIDEAMLPLPQSITEDPQYLESQEELEDIERNEVSTLRLKFAAAKLQDFHNGSDNDSCPPTIWSFDKFSRVDEETQSFLQDMDKKIQALKNRPQSATKSSFAEMSFQEDQSGEEFPETSSSINSYSQENDSRNNSEILVAKFQELLQQATYQPDASLQWQVDHDRLQLLQHILRETVNEDDGDDDYEEETDGYDALHNVNSNEQTRQKGNKNNRHEHTSAFDETTNKVEMSRIDYESKNATSNWCLDQQQQMLLAELEMDREMAALTAALSQSAYELDAIEKISS